MSLRAYPQIVSNLILGDEEREDLGASRAKLLLEDGTGQDGTGQVVDGIG